MSEQDTSLQPRVWHVLPLGLLTLALLAAVSTLHSGLDERIQDNAHKQRLARMRAVVPEHYQILEQPLVLKSAPGAQAVFPVVSSEQQQGVVLTPVRARGYQGPITLLLGIRRDGMLWGVRVLEQQETPGFGDQIQQSDWILGLSGYGLDTDTRQAARHHAANADEQSHQQAPDGSGHFISPQRFALREDGGEFDQISGATITSRAVLEASKKALQYHNRHRATLYPHANIGQCVSASCPQADNNPQTR